MIPQRHEEFAACVVGTEDNDLQQFDQLCLVQSNSTRWNSLYRSIGRALNLRGRIDRFVQRHKPLPKSKGLKEDILIHAHWIVLESLHTALESYYQVTTVAEGRDHTLYRYFGYLDFLLDHFADWEAQYKQQYDDDPTEENAFLIKAAHSAWVSLEKYYKLCDEAPVVYAALVMHPAYKLGWLENSWSSPPKSEWLPSVKQQVRKLWEDFLKQDDVDADLKSRGGARNRALERSPPPPLADSTLVAHNFDNIFSHCKFTKKPTTSLDAYQTYCETDVGPDTEINALEYWNSRYTSQLQLAAFALTLFAIPSMASECERVFSSSGLCVTDRRNRLNADTIEASECLRHWFGKPEADAFAEDVTAKDDQE